MAWACTARTGEIVVRHEQVMQGGGFAQLPIQVTVPSTRAFPLNQLVKDVATTPRGRVVYNWSDSPRRCGRVEVRRFEERADHVCES